MTVHPTPWPPGRLATWELSKERAELEHRLGDTDVYVTAATREAWCERLTAIKHEQTTRAEAERQARADAVRAARRDA